MSKLSNRAISIVTLIAAMFVLIGCQSVPSNSEKTAEKPRSATASDKEKDYEKLLQEWQTLKPGISRLIAIESELNLLLGELENLQTSLAEQQTQQVARVQAPAPAPQVNRTEPAPAPVSAPVSVVAPAPLVAAAPVQPVMASTSAATGNYALQVASITESNQLTTTWQQLQNRHPDLLEDLEPNFQKIQVKNTDYYRLKLGSFDTLQAANQKCSQLKAAGVSCLVADYTSSNFSQLTNQMLVAR